MALTDRLVSALILSFLVSMLDESFPRPFLPCTTGRPGPSVPEPVCWRRPSSERQNTKR